MNMGVRNFGRAGARPSRNRKRGYTVVELMVTIVIVAVLAATVGVFFVKLLTIQEQDREEAYVREKLADICGAYADALSIGTTIGTHANLTNQTMDVRVFYRHETGGVSLETGVVTRVAQVTSSVNPRDGMSGLSVESLELGDMVQKLLRKTSGDARLIPLAGDMVSCTITPLGYTKNELRDGFQTTDAALGYLEVAARYVTKNKEGELVAKTTTVGRVVRLWNRE